MKYKINKPDLKKFLNQNELGNLVDWDNLEYSVTVNYNPLTGVITFGNSTKYANQDRYWIGAKKSRKVDFAKEFKSNRIKK